LPHPGVESCADLSLWGASSGPRFHAGSRLRKTLPPSFPPWFLKKRAFPLIAPASFQNGTDPPSWKTGRETPCIFIEDLCLYQEGKDVFLGIKGALLRGGGAAAHGVDLPPPYPGIVKSFWVWSFCHPPALCNPPLEKPFKGKKFLGHKRKNPSVLGRGVRNGVIATLGRALYLLIARLFALHRNWEGSL